MSTITIYLPKNTKLAVAEGDLVMFGQSLSKSDQSASMIYDLAKLFSVKPSVVADLVVRKEGEHVAKGEVLAKKRGMLSTKMFKAPFDGKIVHIDRERGLLEITADHMEETNIISPVEGRIKKITKEEIVIDFAGVVVYAKQGIGKVKKGLLAVVGNEDEDVALASITDVHEQKVLLGGHFKRPVIEKAYGLGAVSVVATQIDENDFPYFEDKQIFEASLLLVSKSDFHELKSLEGKEAVVEGTHKRIIIP